MSVKGNDPAQHQFHCNFSLLDIPFFVLLLFFFYLLTKQDTGWFWQDISIGGLVCLCCVSFSLATVLGGCTVALFSPFALCNGLEVSKKSGTATDEARHAVFV